MTDLHQEIVERQVPARLAGERLDKLAVSLFKGCSRSRLKRWISEGVLRVDGHIRMPDYKVRVGEKITLQIPEEQPDAWVPETGIVFQVLHETASYLIINKPAGLAVHPGAGCQTGTLANGLLARYPELQSVPRAGIVHRLDKDTTGLLVIARTEAAYTYFIESFKSHRIKRQYIAVVEGRLLTPARIVAPIGRHPRRRLQMAVVESGRFAATQVRPLEHYEQHSLVGLTMETGRTHQIRVHLRWHGYPVLGDGLYGRKRQRRSSTYPPPVAACIQGFQRQALHAAVLSFSCPDSNQPVQFAPDEWPHDFQLLVDQLRTTAESLAE